MKTKTGVRQSTKQGYVTVQRLLAKEAFGKALGTGIRGFSLCEAEVLHKENGAPYLFLSGKAKAVSDKIHAEFSLSLSHDGDYATAFVICVTKGENIL